MFSFNVGDGYAEAIVRGYKQGFLTTAQYAQLCQCSGLDELCTQLMATDYHDVLQEGGAGGKGARGSACSPAQLASRLQTQLVQQFRYVQSVASPALAAFLDTIRPGGRSNPLAGLRAALAAPVAS